MLCCLADRDNLNILFSWTISETHFFTGYYTLVRPFSLRTLTSLPIGSWSQHWKVTDLRPPENASVNKVSVIGYNSSQESQR